MPLSAEQKAANKAAVSRRNRAYSARVKAFKAAEAAAVAAARGGLEKAAQEAHDLENGLLAERDAVDAALREQIEALESQRAQNRRLFEPRLEAAKRARHEAWGVVRAAERDAQRRVLEQFPDMAGSALWSAAAWGETEPGKAAWAGEIEASVEASG